MKDSVISDVSYKVQNSMLSKEILLLQIKTVHILKANKRTKIMKSAKVSMLPSHTTGSTEKKLSIWES